jgi:hypothetical protein
MNMNSPALLLEAPAGAFVIEDPMGVRALIKAFAFHLLDGAWNPVPDFSGELTPGEVRRYFSRAALAAEDVRGDEAPCIYWKSQYAGSLEITWESRGTNERWVQLSLEKGEWTLLWQSGTGRESMFIKQSFMEPLLWACPGLDWNRPRVRAEGGGTWVAKP